MNAIVKDIDTDPLPSYMFYDPIKDTYVELCIVGVGPISFGYLECVIYLGVHPNGKVYEVYPERNIAFQNCVDILINYQNDIEWFISDCTITFKK